MAPALAGRFCLAATALLALAAGCAASESGGAGGTTAASALKSCGPEGLIDDGEDSNNKIAGVAGRGGYWYTFVDKIGTTTSPSGTFKMEPGGANNSKFAARFKGKIGAADQPPNYLFAGMGLNFVDPKNQYDASKYKGIGFWAKKGGGATGKVRMKVPDVNSDPAGKVCTDGCFNDFGADLDLTDQWTHYAFSWSDLHQLPGWGSPSPDAITPQKLYGIQFQVNQPSADYDVWIDDLEFLCQ
jgi:endoglucanase